MTPKMRRVLEVLADHGEPMTPNAIGYSMGDLRPPNVQTRSGSSPTAGRSMAPGSLIVSTLRALERRGFIGWGARRDGLSGTAYFITQTGRAALAAEQDA